MVNYNLIRLALFFLFQAIWLSRISYVGQVLGGGY